MKYLIAIIFMCSVLFAQTSVKQQKLIDGFESAEDKISVLFFKPYFYAPRTYCVLLDENDQFLKVGFDRYTIKQDHSGPLFKDQDFDLQKIVLTNIGPYKFIGIAHQYIKMQETENEIIMITEGSIGQLPVHRYQTNFRQSGDFVFFRFQSLTTDLIDYYGYCW